jgi:hypothetical protein
LIQEDFALIVQADGHAINPHSWSNEFLLYDYVGSPFNLNLIPHLEYAVGNGGFSLRSYKLCQALKEMGVTASSRSEDILICWDFRRRLQTEFNIQYCPLDLAYQFSIDLNDNFKNGQPLDLEWIGKSFGFHGLCKATEHYGELAGSILPGYKERTESLKIAVYTIALNEEKYVDTWFNSVSDADYWLVADTGSTDSTVSRLREKGVKCEVIHVRPWRFDLARNIALSLIPADADICVSMDMDEHMLPGWRSQLEQAWTSQTTRASYAYHTSYTPGAAPDLIYTANKIHDRKMYTWKRPVHESVFTDHVECVTYIPHMIQMHVPDPTKHRSQYLPLLELSHTENPDCAQTLFWLAREHAHNSNSEQAITYFK